MQFILQPSVGLLVDPVVIALPYSLSRALAKRIAGGLAQQGTAAGRPGWFVKFL